MPSRAPSASGPRAGVGVGFRSCARGRPGGWLVAFVHHHITRPMGYDRSAGQGRGEGKTGGEGWRVRILGLSEIVVVVGCLVACSLQIWGVMEAIGEIVVAVRLGDRESTHLNSSHR